MHSFESLGLKSPLVKAIAGLGFETPTPVQEKVIPHLLEGFTDLVALSQTGTGKTAAFGLPLLTLLDFYSNNSQALVLCPTRELCIQIARDLQSYSAYLPNVHIVPIYGGAAISVQIQAVKKGAHIIVATPGRMVDMIKRKKVNLDYIRYVVLDEADEMLNMGFKEDLDTILSKTPAQKNTWLFSATMPDEVLRISKNYMHDPVEMTMGSKNQANENIEHIYFSVRSTDKYAALKRMIDYHQDIFGIIFCRTKRETQQIADQLLKDGYSADALHGDLSQAQRDQVMKRYRSRMIRLLIATDVAARGIDVDDITHVINYNLPDELENYTHRSGRTARAGKKGMALSMVSPADQNKIRIIERIIKRKFVKGKLPSVQEVREKQLFHIVKNITEAPVDENRISAILPQAFTALEHLSKEELISRFLSMECDRLPVISTGQIGEISSYNERNGNVKLYINLGKYDDLDKAALASFISQHAGIEERAVTIEELKNSFSIIRLKKEMLNPVMAGLKNKSLGSRTVRLEVKNNAAGKRNKERKYSNNTGLKERKRKRTHSTMRYK